MVGGASHPRRRIDQPGRHDDLGGLRAGHRAQPLDAFDALHLVGAVKLSLGDAKLRPVFLVLLRRRRRPSHNTDQHCRQQKPPQLPHGYSPFRTGTSPISPSPAQIAKRHTRQANLFRAVYPIWGFRARIGFIADYRRQRIAGNGLAGVGAVAAGALRPAKPNDAG